MVKAFVITNIVIWGISLIGSLSMLRSGDGTWTFFLSLGMLVWSIVVLTNKKEPLQ